MDIISVVFSECDLSPPAFLLLNSMPNWKNDRAPLYTSNGRAIEWVEGEQEKYHSQSKVFEAFAKLFIIIKRKD